MVITTVELLDLDWTSLFDGLTTEKMWHFFHSIYCKLLDKYIPSVISKVKDSPSPQWMNKSVKNKINLKRKAWIKYKRSKHPLDHSNYILHRNECTAAVRKAKYDFESSLIKGIKVNPKRFWKYVSSQSKVRHPVGGLLKSDGSLTADDCDTANTLNNFFGSVFSQENPESIPSFGAWSSGSTLTSVSVTVDDVWKQLCSLKPHKSSGPDNCHPRVLLELKEGLVQPLI